MRNVNKKRLRTVALVLACIGVVCLIASFALAAWKMTASDGASMGIIGGADAPTFWFVFFHSQGVSPVMLCVDAAICLAAALLIWFHTKK